MKVAIGHKSANEDRLSDHDRWIAEIERRIGQGLAEPVRPCTRRNRNGENVVSLVMRALAVATVLVACAPPRPAPVIGPSRPAPPSAEAARPPESPWPVPMRVMVWTPDGTRQIGELPGAPPATPPTQPWFVEPTRTLDRGTFAKTVKAVRDEHVPGLSLQGQPVEAWLGELVELPELTALILDDTAVGAAALAAIDAPLERLYLARTPIDDAAVAALAAKPALAGLHVLDLEDCSITDRSMTGIASLADLHALNLSGTLITDAGGAQLGALRTLAIIDLGGTKIGARTVAALRPLPLFEVFLDSTFVGKEIATLGGFAPGLTRFDVSTLQTYKPTDADLAWLATAPRLTEVGLSGARVHDRLVQQLAALPGLRKLRVAGTPITLPTIQAIARRTQLEEVDLAQTPVDDASASALLAMPNMRVLRLDSTAVGDAALRVTPSAALVELYVSKTKITDAGLVILDQLPKLEALGLGETQVGDVTIGRITKMSGLRTLVLTQATASSGGLATLGTLTELERLYLANTGADDVTLVGLAPLRELHTLHLANSQVSEQGLPVLRSFSQLDELTLGDTRMRAGIADLSAWPHLRTLTLTGLELGDAALATIAQRTTLVTLDVSATEVRDITPLVGLSHLRTLGLVGAKLDAAGTAAMKKLAARGVEIVQ